MNVLLALVVLFHGLGHVLFLGPTIRLANWADQTGHSWLVTPVLGDTATVLVGGTIWIATIALFLGGVGGFLAGQDWWRTVTVAAAVLSIIGIALMWDGIAPTNALFALAVDGLILGSLLWLHWPAPEVAAS
jgi:hypothetical protein